jgi:hypothetical protein
MSILVLMAAFFFTCNPTPGTTLAGAPKARQHGQGALEFSLAAVPVLLAALAGIEAVHWNTTRQLTNQALMQALRAGITEHASPAAIANAFNESMLLRFAPSAGASAQQSQQKRYLIHTAQLGAPWLMRIASPTVAHFKRYADPSLVISRKTGLAAIRNSYQLEYHLQHDSAAAPDSGADTNPLPTNIFQANMLTLKVLYPHSPLLPGMRGLFRMLGNAKGTAVDRTLAAGYLPIVQEMSLPMQSDPVLWPLSGYPGFYRTQADEPGFGNSPGAAPACSGLWCGRTRTGPPAQAGNQGLPFDPRNPEESWQGPASDGTTPPAPQPGPAGGPLQIEPSSPQCGVTVCCLPDLAA